MGKLEDGRLVRSGAGHGPSAGCLRGRIPTATIGMERAMLGNWEQRFVTDPDILVGKPVVKGTRLAVEFILGLLAEGWTEAEVLSNYPGLTRDDVLACLAYATVRLQSERV